MEIPQDSFEPYSSPNAVGGQMSPLPTGPLVANTRIPKTIGVLNIVFGSLLVLCCGCYSVQLLAQSFMGPNMMGMQQQQMQTQFEAQRAMQSQQLRKEEEAAETEEEKAEIRARRQRLEAMPLPKMPDLTKIYNSSAMGFFYVDFISSVLVNLAMLIFGVGLLNLKEWARRGSIWLAAVKVVRLVLLYGFFVAVIVPELIRLMREFFAEIFNSIPPGQGGPNPEELLNTVVTMYGTMFTVWGVATMLLGSIYPLITWFLLRRPDVQAACKYQLVPAQALPSA